MRSNRDWEKDMSLSRIFRLCILVILTVGPAGTAFAKKSDAASELTKAAEHFGDHALSAQSLKTVATVTAPNGDFITEARINDDGLIYFRQAYSDTETLIAMHDGALSGKNANGEIVAAGPEMASFVASHAIHWDVMHAQETFSETELGDVQRFDGQNAIPVRMKGHGGQPTVLFLRASDRLPLGMKIFPSGRNTPVISYYRDWIEVDGADTFSRMIIADGKDIYVYQFTLISFGELGDADFNLQG